MIKNLDQLIDKAKKQSIKRLVIAAAEDKYVMHAIAKAKELGLIAPIFVGNKLSIIDISVSLGLKINESEIIDQPDKELACKEAVNMVSDGKADILMKGLVSTGTLLKQVVSKDNGLSGDSLLSHLAIFESPFYHKIFGLTDAAMNIAPSVEEKIIIIDNAVKAFKQIGVENPLVALITALEKVNPKILATVEAVKIKEITKSGKHLNCIIDGPFGLDNAISKEAAMHKDIKSEVAGNADILVTPELNAGNILYKSLSFLCKARCAAIIVGSKAPIVLTSRADNEETKFLSIALGVLIS